MAEKKMHPANLKRKLERDDKLQRLEQLITRDGAYVKDVYHLMGLRPATVAKMLCDLNAQGRVMQRKLSTGYKGGRMYYFHIDTTEDEIELTAHKVRFQMKAEVEKKAEKQTKILDLPSPLLNMMGYTKFIPDTGQRFNVDEYSSRHPDWNKYQSHRSPAYSNMGCAAAMMIESAIG